MAQELAPRFCPFCGSDRVWDLGISKIDPPTYGCGNCDRSFELTLADD